MTRFNAILAALAAWLIAALPATAAPPPVTVFAAASLQNALTDVGQAYTAKTGVPIRFSFAGSSAIARQIEQGAPADLFISADVEWMDYLAQRRLIVAASRRDLLSNDLVLIAPKDARATLRIAKGFPLAKALGPGRLALADPATVPAGKYAKASLTALGVWDQVSGHVASAENVRAALAYVARGEAPFGIVYATDAAVEPKVRTVGTFPEASHPRIVYPGALTAASRNPAAAGFLGFLQGPEATAVFRRYGFNILARPG
ncbi:MAG: molybdate ABC transporter substrate-binding protein [Caulobacteraceae bacterium]|nr:molybdate ABC transporter substrate-binding protein [Caulobacteraceae bacterium]